MACIVFHFIQMQSGCLNQCLNQIVFFKLHTFPSLVVCVYNESVFLKQNIYRTNTVSLRAFPTAITRTSLLGVCRESKHALFSSCHISVKELLIWAQCLSRDTASVGSEMLTHLMKKNIETQNLKAESVSNLNNFLLI